MAIELSITTDEDEVIATVTGEIKEQCSDTLSGLKLNKSTVETALKELYPSREFNNFYLSGYTKTITPESEDVEVVSERVEPLIIASDTLSNNSRRETGTYTTNLTHAVTNTVAVTWSSSNQFTKGFKVECDLKIKGSGHMSWTSTTGTDTTKSKSITVGSNRGVSVELSPGRKVTANLQINRRIVTLEVPFTVDIGGSVVGCYGSDRTKTFKMKDVLEAAGKRSSYRTKATIVVDCFTDAKVDLKDA